MAELETILAPPEDREAAQARANQTAMQSLSHGLLAPPPKKAPSKKTS